MTEIIDRIAAELAVVPERVKAVAELFDEGATVPFIARYRKEATGGLDETKIFSIRELLDKFIELEKRRSFILSTLQKQGVLDAVLSDKIKKAAELSTLEDLYLPFKPKRKTRAALAREKGLCPLSEAILAFRTDIERYAEEFLNEEKKVFSVEDAVAGAQDIVSEILSEDSEVRGSLRSFFRDRACVESKVVTGKEDEGKTYRDYFSFSEPAARIPSHRLLAILRGEKEGFLRVKALPDEDQALVLVEKHFLKGKRPTRYLKEAVVDGYARLLRPSMENELLSSLKTATHLEAIRVFAANLRDILLEPPLGGKKVLAVDPGFRTGCKIVVLSGEGKLLANATIYPLEPICKRSEAAARVSELFERFKFEAIAVGNGTGGRESEAFLLDVMKGRDVPVIVVNESGASVYSASESARKEFPEYDLTVRGAVSIGRRLQDPLAEIVKIAPEAIGVGQYQHDVDQKELKKALSDIVMSCVNSVGVNVNSAGIELLKYVSGLTDKTASAIVEYRNSTGPYMRRKDLNKVPGLGPKTFEQAAGFLRIPGGKDPLDASAVHPERYELVRRMAKDLACTVEDLLSSKEKRSILDPARYVEKDIGLPTLEDILRELEKPGRDPRQQFEAWSFAEGVSAISDLKAGMVLPGIVTNVTNFGAFVDIGVHQDGLVHISEMSETYISDPHAVVKVRQKVLVRVLSIEEERKRIALSLRT